MESAHPLELIVKIVKDSFFDWKEYTDLKTSVELNQTISGLCDIFLTLLLPLLVIGGQISHQNILRGTSLHQRCDLNKAAKLTTIHVTFFSVLCLLDL